jgi:hypothetical protein
MGPPSAPLRAARLKKKPSAEIAKRIWNSTNRLESFLCREKKEKEADEDLA